MSNSRTGQNGNNSKKPPFKVKLRRGLEWTSFRLLGIGTITLALFTFAEIGVRWYESETRGDMKIIARAESGQYKADSIPPSD